MNTKVKNPIELSRLGVSPDNPALTALALYAKADGNLYTKDGLGAENMVGGPAFEIGDIRTTLCTDLGTDWLLCNGASVNFGTYPGLASILVDTPPSGTWTSNTQGFATFENVAYGNGYWVAVGSSGEVYYKADTPDGAWTENVQGSGMFTSVAYGNDYWVAIGQSGLLYYKQGTPVGAWTANNQGTNAWRSVAYGNNYWVIVGDSGNTKYKAFNPTGTWTSNNPSALHLVSVAYGNGYWVIGGDSGGALYYRANEPLSTWTSNTQGSSQNSIMAYGNGYWITNGYYKALTPDGAWTANAQITGKKAEYASGFWRSVGTANGTIRYKALTPDGTWTDNSTGASYMFYGICTAAGYSVTVGQSGRLFYKAPQLPTISIGAPAYIKGK